jgi:hypothetical protein
VIATTSSRDVAALVASVVAAVLVLALLVALVALVRAIKTLRETAEQLRANTLPLVVEARAAVSQANDDLERVDGLVGRAGSISATVDSASKLAYLTVFNPTVKLLAFSTGVSRAVRVFRRRR